MEGTFTILKELKRIESMKRSGKHDDQWDYLGGAQQALSWVLNSKLSMSPAKLGILENRARSKTLEGGG